MITTKIAEALNIKRENVENTLRLLEQGATIPFIARYRKEATESLTELQIEAISTEYKKNSELIKRRETILNSIEEQDALTDLLRDKIASCWVPSELEDIYLPFKPKRRTKAQIAIERGLMPLAKIIMAQTAKDIDSIAKKNINGDIKSEKEAIEGVIDIIAEWISENSYARNSIRKLFRHKATITSKLVKDKEQEAQNFKDYFDFALPLRKIKSHTLLAIRRGEQLGLLKVNIAIDLDEAIETLEKIFIKNNTPSAKIVEDAIVSSYKRLIKPSIENEFAAQSKENADKEAIKIFSENLRQLLLAPPLGQKRVLAIDPGYRTGCKIVALDPQGNLIHNDTIYPHPPMNKEIEAIRKIKNLVNVYRIQAIAIGNGTAGRETETFIKKIKFADPPKVFVVNEAGASVYSASKIAREEFADYDITVRGAVSLGRRLIDPLAELVKIEPKAIGVGQYQHDVNQKELKEGLDLVVSSCVNTVGVNVNTATKYILTYVSGIGEALAENIIEYRDKNGAFKSRKELMKVPKMGEKSFQQAAGFIRIENSSNPLDNSAVHPETYSIVEQMAKDINIEIENLIANKKAIESINIDKYITKNIGRPTLSDIIKELEKPTRDPREKIEVFEFDKDIKTIHDLKVGMKINGIATNITKFGAFIDIGIHHGALLHISEMKDGFVSDPTEIIKLNQHIKVTILNIDLERKRIYLTLKE